MHNDPPVHSTWPKWEKWLNEWKPLTNFGPHEPLYLGSGHNNPTDSGYRLNGYPGRDLWSHIVDRLMPHVQRIRTEFGGALLLTSVFRNKAYNRTRTGASPNSFHRQAMAADIVPVNGDVEKLYDIADRLTPSGGVGRYTTFVHVDTRGWRARW